MQHEENWMLSPEVEQEAFWNTMSNNDISGEKILKAATAYDKTMKRDEMIVKVKCKIGASMDHSYAREYPTRRYKIENDEAQPATANGKPAADNAQATDSEKKTNN